MRITRDIFAAHLKCKTKCWLKAAGEPIEEDSYCSWMNKRNAQYRTRGVQRLFDGVPVEECIGFLSRHELRRSWSLAIDVDVQTECLESRIDAVERSPSSQRHKVPQIKPVNFVFANKIGVYERMLLAFDALALGEHLGIDISSGRIVHGTECTVTSVKIQPLKAQVRKHLKEIEALFCRSSDPDLVLNRHCAECEFQKRCHQRATEKDDLSLLPGVKPKEREEYHAKGIFTVTQLSYTFRPRRRPKHLRGKAEKFHHSLKALAHRDGKTYVVGEPEWKIAGTPVYLDVESLPDRDFYYLIGALVRTAEGFCHHSFWADGPEKMGQIWAEFLSLLTSIDSPCLIHYGSFEATFLKRMYTQFGGPPVDAPSVVQAIEHPVNLLSSIYAKIYFPTLSNGLKAIAGALGFQWSAKDVSGILSIRWRSEWDDSRIPDLKEKLITYNREDCEALAMVEEAVARLATRSEHSCSADPDQKASEVVYTGEMKARDSRQWGRFSSSLTDLEVVNNAAYWHYQRDRVYVRSSGILKRAKRKAGMKPHSWVPDKIVVCLASPLCPFCQHEGKKHGQLRTRTRQTIIFGRYSLKRRVVQYQHQEYRCPNCNKTYGIDESLRKHGKPARYDRSLLAYLFYQIVELGIPAAVVERSVGRLFGLRFNPGTVNFFKTQLSEFYAQTRDDILRRLSTGELVHADETHVSIQGVRAYVWVFTNMHEVAYVFSKTREGDLVHAILGGFSGVLVTDFYAVYDSLSCPQQKCLIHLVRDLNGMMLDNPYDEELRAIVGCFGQLLRTIIEDVDRHGLKKHFLHKHKRAVERFYRKSIESDHKSPAALECVERFKKNRNKLFTFLDYDGVPWNNNNAEHAIKAFVRVRENIRGASTEKGIEEYLTLLSVCQTCKYQGLDFLDFLRSGDQDIEVFATKTR